MENRIKTNEIQSFTKKINFGQTKYTCYTVAGLFCGRKILQIAGISVFCE